VAAAMQKEALRQHQSSNIQVSISAHSLTPTAPNEKAELPGGFATATSPEDNLRQRN